MQPTKNYLAALRPIPMRQFVGATVKRQMHGDADDFGKRLAWRRALQQIFIPITHAPIRGRWRGSRSQRPARGQYMLAKTAMRRSRIERIDEQYRQVRWYAARWRWKFWGNLHFRGQPERLAGVIK